MKSHSIDNLLAVNKKAIFDKLNSVYRTKNGYYKCNDVIDVLSEAKVRDKRLINDYSDEEIVVRKAQVNGLTRDCRFFTPLGIKRYLKEGKIYSCKNACEYFGVIYVSKEEKEIENLKINREEKMCDVLFDKKRTLKWLFEKRKSIKLLQDTLNTKELLEWLESYEDDDIIDDKKERLLKYLSS